MVREKLMNTQKDSEPNVKVTWKSIARKVLPDGAQRLLGQVSYDLHLSRFRRRMCSAPFGTNATGQIWDYPVRINDGKNFYGIYKDIFVNRIYHFESRRADPFILDCGGNIGGSILYFKHVYPQARIISFEPDPTIFPYLEENVRRNGLTNVQLVQAGLSAQEGTLTFYSDGKVGSRVAEQEPDDNNETWTKHQISCVRLRDYLTEPVDFLKMNIEGAEWDVLQDSGDRLRQVREMVIEYHHFPGLPRTLHRILGLLDEQGFEYVVNCFDSDTNRSAYPPFHLTPQTQYCLLVYARSMN